MATRWKSRNENDDAARGSRSCGAAFAPRINGDIGLVGEVAEFSVGAHGISHGIPPLRTVISGEAQYAVSIFEPCEPSSEVCSTPHGLR